MAWLEVLPEYLTPISVARSKHARLSIPLPSEVDQRKIGVCLDTLDLKLKDAGIAFMTIDGNYSARKGSTTDKFASYEYRIKPPINDSAPHSCIWATAHLGLNISQIGKEIVLKQKNAESSEEAWMESLDRVVNDSIYSIATKEILFKNLTKTDKEILFGSAISALSVFAIGLSRIGLSDPYLVAASSALAFLIANTGGTLLTKIVPQYITDSDGARVNMITPELDRALILYLSNVLTKTFGIITSSKQ